MRGFSFLGAGPGLDRSVIAVHCAVTTHDRFPMLQKLRETTSGWIATVILGLLTVPFALFGIEQYTGAHSDTFAARIQAPPTWWASAPAWWPASKLWDTRDITTEEFRRNLDLARQSAREQQGDAFNSEQFESAANKRQLLDQMIDARIMQMASDRNGVAVSDVAVRDAVQAMPEFQVDGKFNLARYQSVLSSLQQPMTPAQFEQSIRDDLERNALAGRIASSDFITRAEGQRMLDILTEQRVVENAILAKLPVDTAPVAEADIASWYKAHSGDYKLPQTVTVEYVDADPAAMPPVVIDDAALQKRYDAEKSKYVSGDQRLVSHILVAVPQGANAAADKAAEAKADQLAEQARRPGADFAALAKANSDDAGSKAAGGDLGWISRDGSMAKPFEDAVFAMQAGQVGAPVRTQFGWHVIEVREAKAGVTRSFAEVKPELEQELGKTEATRRLNEGLGELTDEAYKNPAAFGPTATRLKLPLQAAGPLSPGQGDGVLANAAVQRVLFSQALVQGGGVSDPVTIAPGHSVMLHVTAHTPERQRTLAEVHDQVAADVRNERVRKALLAKADAMVAAINAGTPLAQVAAAQGAVVQPSGPIVRGQVPSPSANRAMFAVARPAPGKASAGKVQLPDGSVLVFAVTSTTPGNAAAMPQSERANILQKLADAHGEAAALNYVNGLRKVFHIKVAEDRL